MGLLNFFKNFTHIPFFPFWNNLKSWWYMRKNLVLKPFQSKLPIGCSNIQIFECVFPTNRSLSPTQSQHHHQNWKVSIFTLVPQNIQPSDLDVSIHTNNIFDSKWTLQNHTVYSVGLSFSLQQFTNEGFPTPAPDSTVVSSHAPLVCCHSCFFPVWGTVACPVSSPLRWIKKNFVDLPACSPFYLLEQSGYFQTTYMQNQRPDVP